VIDRNYQRSEQILKDNMDKLHAMAGALIKYETIDTQQIDDIMEGRPPREPQDISSDQDPPASGEGIDLSKPKKKGDKGEGTIGGPAQQH
jgi:cell division protease FtsH